MLTTTIFSIISFFKIDRYFIMKKLFKFSYLSLLISIIMIFLINPGIPGRKYFCKNSRTDERKNYDFCYKCNLITPKELNITHCDKCDICILKYDHHCNWIGKCIGKGNIIFFISLVISLFLFLFSAFFIIFIIFIKIYKK